MSITCSSSTSSKQLTLAETTDRVRVWATNDSRAIRVTRKIGEMIAIDCQPLSIVSDPGFSRLMNTVEPRYQLPSRKYVTDKVIPEIASDVKVKVNNHMKDAHWLSFTSDIWSTEVSNDSLLSLMAHWFIWLTKSFDRRNAMLQAQSFPGSHTGEALCAKYKEMFQEWGIRMSNFTCLLLTTPQI